jgi:hypothetical protein
MKYQIFDHSSFRLLVQQIQDDDFNRLFELSNPGLDLEKDKSFFKDILRWEDDGGQILKAGNLLNPDRIFRNKLTNNKSEKRK